MRTKNLLPLIMVMMAALLVTACGAAVQSAPGSDQNVAQDMAAQAVPTLDPLASPGAPVVPVTAPVNAQGEALVATVNDAEITRTDFDRAMTRYQQQQLTASDAVAVQRIVLDTLIDQQLIEQAAAAQNIAITDEEVQAELDANIALAGSPEAWQQWLANNMYTEEEFRDVVRETLLTSRMRDIVTEDLNGPVQQVHARHILVATEGEALGVLERLRAGEDFAAIAAQLSNDVTTREQGGDLGWFAQDALLEPYLAQVAFALQPGETSAPVATSLGFHVIQVLERAEQAIADADRATLAQNRFEGWLTALRGAATIERYI